MIQDIDPHKFQITYQDRKQASEDKVLLFCKNELMIRDTPLLDFPSWEECVSMQLTENKPVHYLFAIDEERFFYIDAGTAFVCPQGFCMAGRQRFRSLRPKHLAFAAVSACMLDGWYQANRFCGRCGKPVLHDKRERMLFCPACENRIYPRINPAVIVAVTNGSRLLLTKYNGRAYKKYALVAGFCEVGETLEDTVRREVKEETGLAVKNIRYYASQPWGFADNLLAGYFCEVDGDDTIELDREELSEACWLEREDIPVEFEDCSLTNEMICAFKNNVSGSI
jgi:NAD+ diphosphatase